MIVILLYYDWPFEGNTVFHLASSSEVIDCLILEENAIDVMRIKALSKTDKSLYELTYFFIIINYFF